MKSRINKLEYNFSIYDKTKYYFKNNNFHRETDLPAIIHNNIKKWYKNGHYHRDNDKPSCIYPDGRMDWYENGNFIKDNYSGIKIK